MTTSIKTCFKCKTAKPLTEFYPHKQMADGHLNKCKECTKRDACKHRESNIDAIRKYDRDRGSRQGYAYIKEYREKFPNKYKAHCRLNNALRFGKVAKQPCEECRREPAVAHHDDYAKPLDVRWLCQAHHKQWHAVHGEAANAS